MNALAPPPITVLNFRRFEKNTLRAFCDLQLASGLVLGGCTLHQSHGKWWVGLPARNYADPDGNEKWVPIVDFASRERKAKFQQLATAAVLAAYERAA
jgi:hypothetical protein